MKVLRTIFEHIPNPDAETTGGRMIIALDIPDESDLLTNGIPDLVEKLESALPGIFPEEDDVYAHRCGSGEDQHDFREEIEKGTNMPHLLEHMILHLLGRSSGRCAGFSGQRSADIERGITSHYYVVVDYGDKVQAVVAADLALQLLCAWRDGRTVRLDPDRVLESIHGRLSDMLA